MMAYEGRVLKKLMPIVMRTCLVLGGWALVVLGACDPTRAMRSQLPIHGVAVTPGETGRVFFVDSVGSLVRHLPLGIAYTVGAAQSADRQTLYLTTQRSDGPLGLLEFIAVDLSEKRVRWREPLGTQQTRRTISGIEIRTSDWLAVSPGGNELITLAVRDGQFGIAALDLATRQTARFAGPFIPHGGVVMLPPSSTFPRGAIVLGASRDVQLRVSSLYFLDPTTLATIDSLSGEQMGLPGNRSIGAFPSRSGDALFLFGNQGIRRYDLATRRITASRAGPLTGDVSPTADGERLVMTDGGQWPDSPGSGKLAVFNASDLTFRGSIQLPSARDGGPRVQGSATAGLGPQNMFVMTGTAPRGTLFEAQSTQLVEVDVATMATIRSIPLNDWGAGRAFAF